LKPAHIISRDELLAIILDAKERFSIDGVTFLGGEPTLQQGLADLSNMIRSNGLGTILFTGRSVEELPKGLMKSIDLIVDGSFEQNHPDTVRNLIGSTNQRLIYVTDRYRSYEQWFYIKRPKHVEINVADGLFITGDII